MPYDADPRTWEWFDRALTEGGRRTRWRAVGLLRVIDGPARARLLSLAEHDADPLIAASAVVIAESIRCGGSRDDDLFESDFAQGRSTGELQWEWEYQVMVCVGGYVPGRGVLVWTRDEDDGEAKRLAIMKATHGRSEPGRCTPMIVGKRYVNRYTRSARSFTEAMMWHRKGRPEPPWNDDHVDP